ncbi:MAG TPA: response regulator [Balneolales bacterium]|nr:response regulator [Balneolales bacterium]
MYTVLVIDDDEPLRIVLEHILSTEFNVLLAHNAQEAIDLLSGHSVNLILSDIYMPGMNGIQLLESLQADADKKNIPVLIMTNLPSDEKKEAAHHLGAADFIDKMLLHQDKKAFLNRVRLKVLTDVNLPDLDEHLNNKKQAIIRSLMNESAFGSFKTITNILCKQLHDLFQVDYSSFWLTKNNNPKLITSYKDDNIPVPSYSADKLVKESDFQKLMNEKQAYFSNHVYDRDSGIMNTYSVENKITAEIGLPVFAVNEKNLLLNNMKISANDSIFAFLDIKRKKLFSTQEFELLKNLTKQMSPAFWRLYQQD